MRRLGRFAASTAAQVGSFRASLAAALFLFVLLATGALRGFSDHWLSVASVLLSAITFLLVFVLQYRETRDTTAIQLKLNELLRAVEGARAEEFHDIEEQDEEEQERVLQDLRKHLTTGAR